MLYFVIDLFVHSFIDLVVCLCVCLGLYVRVFVLLCLLLCVRVCVCVLQVPLDFACCAHSMWVFFWRDDVQVLGIV